MKGSKRWIMYVVSQRVEAKKGNYVTQYFVEYPACAFKQALQEALHKNHAILSVSIIWNCMCIFVYCF